MPPGIYKILVCLNFFSSSMKKFFAPLVALISFSVVSHAQYPNHAVVNTGFSLGLSGADGSWSYYLLSLTSATNGVITGSGTRSDVGPGASEIFPDAPVLVTVADGARFEGPVVSSTNTTTFKRKVGTRTVTLTNQVIADAAFFSAPLSDGGLIKGAFVYTYNRRQTAKLSNKRLVIRWVRTATWYGGQAFGSYDGLTGSTFLGE